MVHPEFSEAVSRGKAARLRWWEMTNRGNAVGEIDGNAKCVELGIKNTGGRDWSDTDVVQHRHLHAPLDLSSLTDQQLASLIEILEAVSPEGADSGDVGQG